MTVAQVLTKISLIMGIDAGEVLGSFSFYLLGLSCPEVHFDVALRVKPRAVYQKSAVQNHATE